MDTSTTPYSASLAFLLSQVGARSAQLFADRLAALAVSPRAFGVLSNLESRSQTQQQLADALGIHRNNMVGLIDELESAGWVERHRSRTDRRAFDIRLTNAGAVLVASVAREVPQLDELLGADLDDEQRRALTHVLQQVARSLHLRPGIHPHLASPPR